MNRAVEIVNSLRAGMEAMLQRGNPGKVSSLRMFNFEKNRVSLYMEVSGPDEVCRPMGRIDVVELPVGGKGRPTCNCEMTDLSSGKSQHLLLRPNSMDEKNLERTKVFNFFRKVLNLPDDDSAPVVGEGADDPHEDVGLASRPNGESVELFPPEGGVLPQNPRGAM